MSIKESGDSNNVTALTQETIWFKQPVFEAAEAQYHIYLAASADLKSAPGTPGKRPHIQDNRSHIKKQKPDSKASLDLWSKKFQAEEAALLRTVKNIFGRLEDLEKAQQRKSQMIKDAAARLTAAVEECQTRLTDELVQSAGRTNVFRSLLSEIEEDLDKITNNFTEHNWGRFKTQEKYCRKMSDRFSKLGRDLNSCIDLCNCFQADVSKSDINRIVGEIGRLSLVKKQWDSDVFLKKKEIVANSMKSLLADSEDAAGGHPSDSDSSLEGSCSVSSDESEARPGGKNQKAQPGKSNKMKKATQNIKVGFNKSIWNGTGPAKDVRNRANADFFASRPNSGPNAPMKRNALGMQSSLDKKQDIFQFKGVPRPATVPFLTQPGLLGPRPNVLPMPGPNSQIPFRFSAFNAGGQKQHPLTNFGQSRNPMAAGNRSGFGNVNFNFSGSQPRASSLDFVQNSVLASMNQQARSNINNQMKQSKMYQFQQDQAKGAKKAEHLLGSKPGLAYSLQQGTGGSGFVQNQAGLLGSRPGSRGTLEQQLNEMAQKIQQMQLATSHNLQLQQLMQETERLKQMVSQKQNQQHDRFQQQFQLLINAFMQQQRQQQFQGPESKMARAVQFQNAQKQQQHNRHLQLQQQKKRKQQQNKVQQVKQEPQKETPKEDTQTEKVKEGSPSDKVLQNGDSSTKKIVDKRIINKNSRVTKIGTFSPQAPGDKHKAGVSSLVVMESISCVVVVDIINSCLKLYNVTSDAASGGLSHSLVTRLELSRPYYMSRLNKEKIVLSREGKVLSIIRVSKKRLEFLQDIKTESQYYGLGYVRDDVIVCAAFVDNRIDLLSIQDGVAQTAVLTQCKGPELVGAVPSTGCILYLERSLNKTVHLLGISQRGDAELSIDLESSPTDVWSVASVHDKIVCCNKQSGKIKLFSETGVFLGDIIFPPGAVNQPFAMAFCDSGHMYIANDGAWDSEYEHYITTDINVYSFS
ncbi:unnamed protein product [Candidula unifasciata]|uniref:Uncharacterized protein n=1 Tax=Candidula unifasciata TaxID=100452 RepID=A0A8S3YM09_9EUPU|nr:unnamed protein product [Candidula unifasciata]